MLDSSRLSQLNPKNLGMLSKVDKLLVIINLPNLMSKYGTPFFGVDKLTYNLFAIESDYMVLITEEETIMPQASDILRCVIWTYHVPSVPP